MNVKDFRDRLKADTLDNILVEVLLSDDAAHCDEKGTDFIKAVLSNTYKVNREEIRVIIVGSAKLGFSISEKKIDYATTLKRYRPFGPGSDIDVAVICPRIYEIIWTELSSYSLSQAYLPWDSGKLGDYMVCGWLRPDHFPRGSTFRKCKDWWDVFSMLSRHRTFGMRRVRGGIFYNFDQLKFYHSRALNECIQLENS